MNVLIVSLGRTATNWLSAVLSRHPAMYCAHGFTLLPSALNISADAERMRQQEELLLLEPDVSKYFQMLQNMSDKPILMNIHGFKTDTDITYCESQHDFLTFYLTRHPISRVQSFVAHVSGEMQVPHLLKRHEIQMQRSHESVYGCPYDGPRDTLSFAGIYAICYLLSEEARILNHNISTHAMEAILSSPKELGKYAAELSGGVANNTNTWAEAVMKTPVYNNRKVDILNNFEQWPAVVQEYFIETASRLQLNTFYRSIGYRIP